MNSERTDDFSNNLVKNRLFLQKALGSLENPFLYDLVSKDNKRQQELLENRARSEPLVVDTDTMAKLMTRAQKLRKEKMGRSPKPHGKTTEELKNPMEGKNQ